MMAMMKQIQIVDDRKGNCGEIQVPRPCNSDCLEYKYQIATETAERKASQCKGNCTLECVQVLKDNKFFFLSGMNLGKRSWKVSRRYFRVVMALVWRDIGDGNH